jgi:hypothetical protein
MTPRTATAFDFVVSPHTCFGRTNTDNALIKRTRGAIGNRSKTRSISVICGFPADYSPFAPADSCINNAKFQILVGLRLRFEYSRNPGAVILYRTSDGQADPHYYQKRAKLTTDLSTYDGSSRYFPVFYTASMNCVQRNSARRNIDTEWWGAHVGITLSPGAHVTYVNYFTNTDR